VLVLDTPGHRQSDSILWIPDNLHALK